MVRLRPDLCVITEDAGPGRGHLEVARAALAGGATLLQVRDKAATALALYRLTVALLPLCRAAGVPLIVNDRLDVALAAGADGVHLGQDDLPAAEARPPPPSLMPLRRQPEFSRLPVEYPARI